MLYFFSARVVFFRFHDSGSVLKGFFDFDTQEGLLENLLKHIMTWPEYKDGRVKFTFLRIPSKEEIGD